MSDHLKREHYEDSEGTPLTVHLDDDTTVELTQVDYTDISNEKVDGFSVLFEGPPDQAFDQGSYPVEHANAGKGEVLLVPVVNQESKKRAYQLVVSKLKEDVEGGGES